MEMRRVSKDDEHRPLSARTEDSARNRAKSQPHRDAAAAQALAKVHAQHQDGHKRAHAYSIAVADGGALRASGGNDG